MVILSLYQLLNSTVLSLHFTTYIFTTLLTEIIFSRCAIAPITSTSNHMSLSSYMLLTLQDIIYSSTDDPQKNPSVVHRKSCYLELDHAKFIVIFDREPWHGKYEVDESSLSSQKTSICLS